MKWYEPDEDSYTFLDVLEEENIKNKLVVDLGTSTGVLSTPLKDCLVVGIDKNRLALVEQKRIRKSPNLVVGDLLGSINQKVVDILLFNPPYVLDSSDPIIGGGVLGREIIDKFIEQVEVNLFYLLVIKANRPEEVIEKIEKKKYVVEVKKVRKILGETIIILKCTKVSICTKQVYGQEKRRSHPF